MSREGPPASEVMREFLLQLGVRDSDIILETSSRTTYENAKQSRTLLESRGIHRIILVTCATHLFRAEQCFRGQGFDVIPCGCDYRATRFDPALGRFIPAAGSMNTLGEVTHEWLGVIWYWVCGRF